jgi:hypothetical protein
MLRKRALVQGFCGNVGEARSAANCRDSAVARSFTKHDLTATPQSASEKPPTACLRQSPGTIIVGGPRGV